MTKNNETFINHLLSMTAGFLMTVATATIVANFGWTAIISLISYALTAIVYFVIFILWKD